MSPTPKVLLIGDSISIGYAPFVADGLKGDFAVARHEGNSGDSAELLSNLDSFLAAADGADVIHFNVGLHDLKLPRDAVGHQVPLEAYRRNLTRIVERLRSTGASLIWASITPVLDERHHRVKPFDRREEDVQAYNAAATDIVSSAGIPIDDLHAVTVEAGVERTICEDGVHMTEEGYAVLARAVCDAIRKHARGEP